MLILCLPYSRFIMSNSPFCIVIPTSLLSTKTVALSTNFIVSLSIILTVIVAVGMGEADGLGKIEKVGEAVGSNENVGVGEGFWVDWLVVA